MKREEITEKGGEREREREREGKKRIARQRMNAHARIIDYTCSNRPRNSPSSSNAAIRRRGFNQRRCKSPRRRLFHSFFSLLLLLLLLLVRSFFSPVHRPPLLPSHLAARFPSSPFFNFISEQQLDYAGPNPSRTGIIKARENCRQM